MMNALLIDHPGADFNSARIARPEPKAGEVLVRIKASGVNPLDLKIRAGAAPHAQHPLPAILGLDLAGVVEVGNAEFKPGDEVYGLTGGVGGVPGSLAEYASVDARLLARKPANLSMRQAAALPLAVITAWEGLIDRAKVKSGDRVLVIGAGGVGHVAAQLATWRGAEVKILRSADDSRDGLGEFEVVFDSVGDIPTAFAAVTRFGHVVSALGWGTHSLAPLSFKAASYSGIFTLAPLLTGVGREQHGSILRAAARLAEEGDLVPLLDHRRFTLETAGEAHALLGARQARGKLVVDID